MGYKLVRENADTMQTKDIWEARTRRQANVDRTQLA